MNVFEALEMVSRQGMAILEECARRAPGDVATRLGVSVAQARRWRRLAEVYFGPADSPARQARAVAVSRERGWSLERLEMIERHAGRVRGRGRAWALREELCAHAGSFEEVQRLARTRVADLAAPAPPQAGVRISTARDGMRTLSICGDQRMITDLEKTLETYTRGSREPRSLALAGAFWQHVKSGYGLARARYTTVVTVPLESLDKIVAGAGDDVELQLSDGTSMSGVEWLTAVRQGNMSHEVFAGLFHPVAGPVNLYRARFASWKQRILAMAESPRCAWPECNVPADRCEVHHLRAHKHGGETEPGNLTMLCRFHNGRNDDNPEAPPRHGRIERVGGELVWRWKTKKPPEPHGAGGIRGGS